MGVRERPRPLWASLGGSEGALQGASAAFLAKNGQEKKRLAELERERALQEAIARREEADRHLGVLSGPRKGPVRLRIESGEVDSESGFSDIEAPPTD